MDDGYDFFTDSRCVSELAAKGITVLTPFGMIEYRPIDHQSTMGAYVGQLAKKGGKGTMVNWRYVDGSKVQPAEQEIRALRKE